MIAYILTIIVTDHDDLGADEIKQTIEDQRYPNHCIDPQVTGTEAVEIGEWHDDHPPNRTQDPAARHSRLYGQAGENKALSTADAQRRRGAVYAAIVAAQGSGHPKRAAVVRALEALL